MKPNTLDELLDLLPGLRRLRSLNASLLRILLDRPRRHCTWCGVAVPKGRSTWCSNACVESFKSRCCSTTARRIVERRDAGVCQQCGRDTKRAESDYHAELRRLAPSLPRGWLERDAILNPIKARLGFARGQWSEVDHDPPVAEYGGLCDPSRLRLLCGACHAEATKRLAQRLKRKLAAG